MKSRMILVAIIGAITVACGNQTQPATTTRSSQSPSATQNFPATHSQARVPSYQEAKSASELPPTLPADQFSGPTRDAYRAVKEIPETIAQLPCYCYCDASIGHKSLHSCFEDKHASQCTVCVNEALIAYNMQKNGMPPAKIREYIVKQYSREQ